MGRNAMLWGLVCAGLALEGCASSPPERAPRVERVEVPVPVRCEVSVPDRPALPTDSLALDADVWDQMKALREERLRLRAWASALDAAARACQQALPPTAPGAGAEGGSLASAETKPTPREPATRPP